MRNFQHGARLSFGQRLRIEQDPVFLQLQIVCGNAFIERGRSTTVGRVILKAVPRAGDKTINDSAFGQRAVLVLAGVRDCRKFVVIESEHRDPFCPAD